MRKPYNQKLGRRANRPYKLAMMKRILHLILLCTLLPTTVLGQHESAELILINGKIFTADSGKPYAEAIAIRGERIITVGRTYFIPLSA